MKADITSALVNEHKLILRMITLLELNTQKTAVGSYDNWQFFLDGVDFIRNFADRYHHAKEEDVLFEALIKNGMPRENSPIAAMLIEHDQGRAFVKAMESAAKLAQAGVTAELPALVENARAYAGLLREHITKEDDILYPLAERVIPDKLRESIINGYAAAESRTAEDFCVKYEALVQQYENES